MIEKLKKLITISATQQVASNDDLRRAGRQTPREIFFTLVEEVADRDRLPLHLAMAKVKQQRPELSAAAFPTRCRGRMEREALAA